MRAKGFTLVEISTVMAIAGSLSLVGVMEDNLENTQDKSRTLGKEIYQYNQAVGRYIAHHGADPAAVEGDYIGSSWLKDSSCGGGATKDFLQCEYLPGDKTIQFGVFPETTLEETANGGLSARTVWSSISGVAGGESMVMGVAALVASGSYLSHDISNASSIMGPTVYCPDMASLSPRIAVICDTDRDRIISLAGSNSALEPWLRTDHGNTMKNTVEFDDGSGNPSDTATLDAVDSSSWRQIVNVSRLYNEGASGVDSVIIGKTHGMDVYTDSFILAQGLLEGALIVDGDLATMENVYAKRSIMAGDYAAAGGAAVINDGDVVAASDVRARNDVVAENDVVSTRDVVVGRNIRVQELLQFVGARTAGGACGPNGIVSRASSGEMLSCVGGRWTFTGSPSGMYSYFSGSSCPIGWVAANGANGTTDLRGEFIRGWDNGRGVDSGRAVGSFQNEAFRSHGHSGSTNNAGNHRHSGSTSYGGVHRHNLFSSRGGNTYTRPCSTCSIRQQAGRDNWDNSEYSLGSAGGDTPTVGVGSYNGGHAHAMSLNYNGTHNHSVSITPSGGPETRPRNRALLVCMKL